MNITFEEIEALIGEATETVDVCVPSMDYYARSSDFSTDKIQFINPQRLLTALQTLMEKKQDGQ